MASTDKRLLWWSPKEERWVEADFNAYTRWRGLEGWLEDGAGEGDRTWPIITEGDHRFVVCVLDGDEQTVISFIAHRCLAGPGGRYAGTPTNLDAAEQKEWDRPYTASAGQIEDEERLRELQKKEFGVLKIPLHQLEALPRDLPWPVTMQTEYGFWQAYRRHGGMIPSMTRAN